MLTKAGEDVIRCCIGPRVRDFVFYLTDSWLIHLHGWNCIVCIFGSSSRSCNFLVRPGQEAAPSQLQGLQPAGTCGAVTDTFIGISKCPFFSKIFCTFSVKRQNRVLSSPVTSRLSGVAWLESTVQCALLWTAGEKCENDFFERPRIWDLA